MNGSDDIRDLSKRLEDIEDILAQIAGGDLFARLKIDMDKADRLTAIETGLNLILSDLENETEQRLSLAEELSKIKKKE
ncbi:hypothetical protein JXM67_14585 [candidate division WOR-3 bacterium]|nr:hypothetical protein [candidate division WOR-3 bacterium]